MYLSFKGPFSFFKLGNNLGEPTWHESDLYYNYSESNDRGLNLTVPVNEKLRNIKTLYLHMQVTIDNPFYDHDLNQTVFKMANGSFDEREMTEDALGNWVPRVSAGYLGPKIKLNQSIPLILYKPKEKEKQLKNLLDSSLPEPTPPP